MQVDSKEISLMQIEQKKKKNPETQPTYLAAVICPLLKLISY